MEIEEFKTRVFKSGMKVIYDGKVFDIVSVDFSEFLIGLEDENFDIFWVRCENIELVK